MVLVNMGKWSIKGLCLLSFPPLLVSALPWLAAVSSWAMDDPTVLEVAPSSSALLSTVSPGKGNSTPAENIQNQHSLQARAIALLQKKHSPQARALLREHTTLRYSLCTRNCPQGRGPDYNINYFCISNVTTLARMVCILFYWVGQGRGGEG